MNISTHGKIDLSDVKFVDPNTDVRRLATNDVLFNNTNSRELIGNTALVTSNHSGLAFSNHMTRVRFNEAIIPAFGSYQLHFLWMAGYFFHKCVKHVNQASISSRDFARFIPIVVAPVEEQRRITTKIEEIYSELYKGVENLERAHAQLKTYRQATLKGAFEGSLTAKWREANKRRLEEPSQRLDRIERARTERYEDQFCNWRMAFDEWKAGPRIERKSPRPAPPRALSPLLKAEMERLPTLPAGWSYVRMGLLIDEPKYGTSKKCDYKFSGTGVLRIPNVVDGVINTDDLKGARFDSSDMQTFSLKQGDVLMIRSNGSISIVGKSAIVSEAEEEYLYAGYLMRLRSNHDVVVPEYLLLVLGSQFMRVQIEEKAKSTSGVNNINAREVQSLVVPLCSIKEQRLIVKHLAKVLSRIDALDREIKDQMSLAGALRQAILARAFSGQLVLQDPSDVPASIVLERISADRARAAKLRTRRPAGERRAARPTL